MDNHLAYPNARVGVFIDVQNMYYTARALYDSYVNFGNILELAISKRQLIRAFAYVVKSEGPKEQGFFEALTKTGWEVRSKDIQVFADGSKKGDWDVGIAIDAVKVADRLDVIVLVSGDGDFQPLVTYLKENKGCRVEGIAFGKSTSAKLVESLDYFHNLDDNPKPYLIRHG